MGSLRPRSAVRFAGVTPAHSRFVPPVLGATPSHHVEQVGTHVVEDGWPAEPPRYGAGSPNPQVARGRSVTTFPIAAAESAGNGRPFERYHEKLWEPEKSQIDTIRNTC